MDQKELQHDLNNSSQIIIDCVELFKNAHNGLQNQTSPLVRYHELQKAVNGLSMVKAGIKKYLNTVSFEYRLCYNSDDTITLEDNY